MKARVMNIKHEFYNCIFEVSYLSYVNAAGYDIKSKNIISAGFEEVEFIYDADWEKEIIKNREILNVKKPKKASYYMYFILLKSIEEHIGLDINELIILKDNEYDSKKVWIKKIVVSVNGSPININITGQNYSNKFEIKITDTDNDLFIKECMEEIEKLQIGLKRDTKRLNGLIKTINYIKNEKVYTSTQGLSLKGA